MQPRANHVDMERLAARKFIQDLQQFIAGLGNLRSPLEVDLALQKFASDYCDGKGIRLLIYCDQIEYVIQLLIQLI